MPYASGFFCGLFIAIPVVFFIVSFFDTFGVRIAYERGWMAGYIDKERGVELTRASRKDPRILKSPQ